MLDLNKTQLTYYSRGGPCAHCHKLIEPGSECYSDGSGFAHRSCGNPFAEVPLTDPVKLVEVRYRQHPRSRAWEFHSEATLFEGPLLAAFSAFGERCALRAQQGFDLKWEFDPGMLLAPAFAMLHGTNGRGDRSMLIWFRNDPVKKSEPELVYQEPVRKQGKYGPYIACANCGGLVDILDSPPMKSVGCRCPKKKLIQVPDEPDREGVIRCRACSGWITGRMRGPHALREVRLGRKCECEVLRPVEQTPQARAPYAPTEVLDAALEATRKARRASLGEKITDALTVPCARSICDCGYNSWNSPKHPTESGHREDCPMHQSFLDFLTQQWWDQTPSGNPTQSHSRCHICGAQESEPCERSCPNYKPPPPTEEDPFEGCPGSGPVAGWSRVGKPETPSQVYGVSKQELEKRVVANFQPPRERTLLDALSPSRREQLRKTAGGRGDFSPRRTRPPDEVEARQMRVLQGTFTVPGNPHRTFKIEGPDRDRKFKPEAFIISLLVGPDNESDYVSFGFVEVEVESGRIAIRVWQSKQNWVSLEILEAANVLLADPMTAGETWAMRSKKCFRCGRKLTVPTSLHRGLGPDCAGKVGL